MSSQHQSTTSQSHAGGAAAGRPTFQAADPSNGAPGRSYEGHTRQQAVSIAKEVYAAFPEWAPAPICRAGEAHARRRCEPAKT